MKAVMISIHPNWCAKIASGRKTIELRKSKPKLEFPFKCYIYCTNEKYLNFWTNKTYCYIDYRSHNAFDLNGNGKVIGEFICDAILTHCEMANADLAEQMGCMKREKIMEYAGNKEVFGWHISDLKIYDTPKMLGEFCRLEKTEEWAFPKRITRPPQSWCYVEEC